MIRRSDTTGEKPTCQISLQSTHCCLATLRFVVAEPFIAMLQNRGLQRVTSNVDTLRSVCPAKATSAKYAIRTDCRSHRTHNKSSGRALNAHLPIGTQCERTRSLPTDGDRRCRIRFTGSLAQDFRCLKFPTAKRLGRLCKCCAGQKPRRHIVSSQRRCHRLDLPTHPNVVSIPF